MKRAAAAVLFLGLLQSAVATNHTCGNYTCSNFGNVGNASAVCPNNGCTNNFCNCSQTCIDHCSEAGIPSQQCSDNPEGTDCTDNYCECPTTTATTTTMQPPSPSPSPEEGDNKNNNGSNNGLSDGEIAAIFAGSVTFVGLIAAVYCKTQLCRNHKTPNTEPNPTTQQTTVALMRAW